MASLADVVALGSLIALGSLCFAQTAPAAESYKVLKTTQTMGTGGIDYVYADNDNRRLYVPRGNQVLAFSIASIFTELVVWLALLALVLIFAFRWIRAYVVRTSLGDERKAAVISGFRLGFRVLFVVVFLILVSRFLEDRIVRLIDDFIKTVQTPFYKSGSTEISILTIVLALPVFWPCGFLPRHP